MRELPCELLPQKGEKSLEAVSYSVIVDNLCANL